MKKLSTSTRQRKKQATTTNMVHVRQVESRNTPSGTIRRATHNRVRSSESMVQSSNSVVDEEEEESVATSIFSNEMLAAGKLKSQESTTDAGTIPKGSTFRSSHEPSESSLTLSLPKEIRTSWLENDPSSDTEAATAKRPLPVQLQRTHTSENRSTAKSIFSTNKSVIMETQRNSISGRQPDASAAAAAMPGHASSRPPDYPPEVTSDTSEYSDVHQYQSLDASFNSHSDKEFRSASSKVPAPGQETQGSDVALGIMPPCREDSGSLTKAKPHETSGRVDIGPTESRGGLDGALRDGRPQPAVPANASMSLDTGMPAWNAGVSSLLDGVSSKDGITEVTRSAIDVPSGASMDSRKDWSTDIFPAVPISPTVSDREAAASLQNIPGKMADLFKAFAAPTKEAEEATSASSATFHMPKEHPDKKGKHCASSQEVGRSSANSRDLFPAQEVNREQVSGVSAMLGTDVPAAPPPHLDGHTSQKGPSGPEKASSHAPLPARKFSLQDDWDIDHEFQAAFGEIPEPAWWNTASGMHPGGATSSEQQRPTTMTGSGVLVPMPSAQPPQKHQSATHSQIGTKFHGVQSVRRVTETVTETHSRRSQSHTQTFTSGIPSAPGNLRAITSSVEQPREPSVKSTVQDGAMSLKGAHDKRAKPEAATSAVPGQRSQKSVDGEHHKPSSTKRTPPGGASTKEHPVPAQSTAAAFPKGEQRHKRSSHSPTSSGAVSPKVSAEGRSEHGANRRSPAGTSSTKVASGGQLQKTPSMLDWRGVASTVQPGLAPIDERLERSTTSFSISEAPAPKPKAHESGAANVDVGNARAPVATSSAPGTEAKAYESMYPLSQGPFVGPAAIAHLSTAPHKILGDQVTETTKLSESTAVRPNVLVEQRFQQSVTRSYSLIPLTEKGPDESRQTGYSATISSEMNIIQEHGKTTTESDVSASSVLHPQEKPVAVAESTVMAPQGAEQSQLPDQSYTAGVLKGTQETDGKTGDLEKLSRQQMLETAEKPKASEMLAQAQGGDDLKLSKPGTTHGVSAAHEEPSSTAVDRVLGLTTGSNQRGITSAADISTGGQLAATTIPEKTADTLQETFGEERPRPSASSPVSTEGREPGFLFEEPLKRPLVSSSWTETSTQDEERRRSSGVAAPRAAHTVPAAAGEEHTGHLALSHGEAEAHHRRTSAPTTGLAGASVLPEEGTTAERSTVPGEPTPKDRQRGSQDRSQSLTPDSGSAQTTKRADVDHHGDMSRKSEEAASAAAVTQDGRGATTGGIFLEDSDHLVVPGSEESASERPATMSDSRGFQPLFGESLPGQARPTGTSEYADAVRKGTSPEDVVSGVPTAALLEADGTMSRDTTEDDDAENSGDLYPVLGPDELRPAISAVHLPSEPREDLIDFEQSTGDKFNIREDASSSTFLPLSSGEVRKEYVAGPRGAPSELLREKSEKYDRERTLRGSSESELCRRLAGSPPDLVFAETALLSRSTSPCTALVELPSEQHITEAPSRELLEQRYLGLDDEPLDESEQPAGSRGVMMAARRIFHVRSPMAGMFPPVQVAVVRQGLAQQQQQTSAEEPARKPPKERKIVPVPAEVVHTVHGAMDTAAPVIALSFALFAFVAAAAILLTREDDIYTEL
ncbi:uncharacterized protein LOC144120907 [Amblyomma americanum]